MMLIINFIFAVIGMIAFRDNDPDHFKSTNLAMMTIWMIETQDSWEEIMYINMFGCHEYYYSDLYDHQVGSYTCNDESSNALGWIATLYFVVVVVFGGLVLPAVLIGVISIAFDESTANLRAERNQQRAVDKILGTARSWKISEADFMSPSQLESLRRVFDMLTKLEGNDQLCSSLDEEELIPFLAFVTKRFLKEIEEGMLEQMFDVVDVDGDGTVRWTEVRTAAIVSCIAHCALFLPFVTPRPLNTCAPAPLRAHFNPTWQFVWLVCFLKKQHLLDAVADRKRFSVACLMRQNEVFTVQNPNRRPEEPRSDDEKAPEPDGTLPVEAAWQELDPVLAAANRINTEWDLSKMPSLEATREAAGAFVKASDRETHRDARLFVGLCDLGLIPSDAGATLKQLKERGVFERLEAVLSEVAPESSSAPEHKMAFYICLPPNEVISK